jgi:hypothetical protein
MKRDPFLPVLAVIMVAMFILGVAKAQQVNLTAPITYTNETNIQVETYTATRDAGGRWEVEFSFRDASNNDRRRAKCSGSNAGAFVTQQMTAVSGETGGDVRRMNARISKFLIDQGNCIPAGTLAP